MQNKILSLVFVLFVFLSCSKDKEGLPAGPKEATGTVWVSGGLFNCHTQIRTTVGDTLIPMVDENNIYPYSMGQKVHVIYEELDNPDSGCSGIACKILKTELIE